MSDQKEELDGKGDQEPNKDEGYPSRGMGIGAGIAIGAGIGVGVGIAMGTGFSLINRSRNKM